MSSLREIKSRISSVKGTLKITSAMKMVASTKLRRAQKAIENMTQYRQALRSILVSTGLDMSLRGIYPADTDNALVVAVASNSSLCGGFNINAIKATKDVISKLEAAGKKVDVWSIGRKMSEAMRRLGYPCGEDFSALCGQPAYDTAASLADRLMDLYKAGEYSSITLVYTHFVSASTQKVIKEAYLPAEFLEEMILEREKPQDSIGELKPIFEPDRIALLGQLLPKVMRLKIYSVLLDSVAAEHAARTLAMQVATDNGNQILQDLTLEYNKGRQQKITSEILDLIGGLQGQ